MRSMLSLTYLAFIFLIAALSEETRATSCTRMNLITQPNSPFNQISVTDQDGAPLCFA
jgi:hypothetical protein